MPTGKDWSNYMEKQTPEHRVKMMKALTTLAQDKMFLETFWYDEGLCTLLSIIQNSLNYNYPICPECKSKGMVFEYGSGNVWMCRKCGLRCDGDKL